MRKINYAESFKDGEFWERTGNFGSRFVTW